MIYDVPCFLLAPTFKKKLFSFTDQTNLTKYLVLIVGSHYFFKVFKNKDELFFLFETIQTTISSEFDNTVLHN